MKMLAVAGTLALGLVGSAAAQTPSPTPSPEVQAQIAANFDKADANKDGKLTREEFANTPRGKAPNDLEESFQVSDHNKDGAVTKAEFMSLKGINVVTQTPPAK